VAATLALIAAFSFALAAALLLSLVQTLNSTLVLNQVLEQVLDAVMRITRAERGFLLLADDSSEAAQYERVAGLRLRVGRNREGGIPTADVQGISTSVVRKAVASGETVATGNAVAAGYHDSFVHPSKPNYIWMVAGQNFGILNNNDPGPGNVIAATSHLADQIEHAGLTWKTYQESMGAPCGLRSHDLYAVKHNPFAYFADINGWDGQTFQPSQRCNDHIVDYSRLDADLASGDVPDYVFITPNLINDMHNGSVAGGDAWLSREVPKILASPAYADGGPRVISNSPHVPVQLPGASRK